MSSGPVSPPAYQPGEQKMQKVPTVNINARVQRRRFQSMYGITNQPGWIFWNISHIRYTGEAERGSRSDPSFCKGQEKYLHGVQQDQVAVNNLGCKENFASFRTF